MTHTAGWRGVVLPLALVVVLLPVFAGGVVLEVGTIQTSGEAPLLTKTGTLRIDNNEAEAMENITATLQEADAGAYTIIDGVVATPAVEANASLESTDTFAVQVDTSTGASPNVPLKWRLEFDRSGEHHQVTVFVILHVPEMSPREGP